MADPLEQYSGRSVFDDDPLTYRPPIPTLAGGMPRPVRSGPVKAEPPPPDEARSYRPSLGDQTRDALEAIGANPQSAATVGRAMPWTPAQPIFEGGQLLAEAAQNRSRGTELLGLGSIALGAAPLPLPAPARRVGAMVRREPPPITGHNIGSLSIPRVPRDVDPSLGLYSAADEAAHSYPRPAGTARDIQDWMASQGVTANEISARGLTDLFRSPQQVITRQQLLTHLGENPIQLRSARYQGEPQYNIIRTEDGAIMDGPFPSASAAHSAAARYRPAGRAFSNDRFAVVEADNLPEGARGPARYGPDQHPDLSLNSAGNPTYREDVLYAPPNLREQARTGRSPLAFTDAHYPNEPNPIGWIRSSRQEAFERGPTGEADLNRPVRGVLWDELQMPMAQRIRDEGGRNEARIANLRRQVADTSSALDRINTDIRAFGQAHGGDSSGWGMLEFGPRLQRLAVAHPGDHPIGSQAAELLDRWRSSEATLSRLRSELRTAESGIIGNPFVNETDQALRTLMHYGLQNPALRDPSVQGIFLTSGVHQNERYNLARVVPRIEVEAALPSEGAMMPGREAGGQRFVYLHSTPRARSFNDDLIGRLDVRPDGTVSNVEGGGNALTGARGKPLSDVVGQDIARQIMAQQPGGRRATINTGAMEVGGHGMRENYDRIYPETLDAILRRLDPAYPGRRRVHLSTRPYVDGAPLQSPRPYEGYLSEPVHYFPLTDRIRAQLARGLPYFAGAGVAAAPALMGDDENRDPLQQYGGAP